MRTNCFIYDLLVEASKIFPKEANLESKFLQLVRQKCNNASREMKTKDRIIKE